VKTSLPASFYCNIRSSVLEALVYCFLPFGVPPSEFCAATSFFFLDPVLLAVNSSAWERSHTAERALSGATLSPGNVNSPVPPPLPTRWCEGSWSHRWPFRFSWNGVVGQVQHQCSDYRNWTENWMSITAAALLLKVSWMLSSISLLQFLNPTKQYLNIESNKKMTMVAIKNKPKTRYTLFSGRRAIARNTCPISGHIVRGNWHFVHNLKTFCWMGIKFCTEHLQGTFILPYFLGIFKKSLKWIIVCPNGCHP
jgi:hypothetical protein